MDTPELKLVILESPYAAETPEEIEENLRYARLCVRDSILRGEAPLASHLLYTQKGILDDKIPEERAMGINAGLAWLKHAKASVVYLDRGLSGGMKQGIARAVDEGRPVEHRYLAGYEPLKETSRFKGEF